MTTLAGVVLFTAGVAAAGVNLKKVILKPGRCVKVAKLQVCAAKARRPVTVTNTVTNTVTSPPVTVTSPPVTVTSTVATPPVTVTVTTTPTPRVAFSDGTYRVGVDIVPGTYRAINPSSSCYWERLREWSGELADIIANEFNGAAIVTIAPTDVGFRSSHCGNWEKIS